MFKTLTAVTLAVFLAGCGQKSTAPTLKASELGFEDQLCRAISNVRCSDCIVTFPYMDGDTPAWATVDVGATRLPIQNCGPDGMNRPGAAEDCEPTIYAGDPPKCEFSHYDPLSMKPVYKCLGNWPPSLRLNF
jgi:hypothetical protein